MFFGKIRHFGDDFHILRVTHDGVIFFIGMESVSYTHLTLPTKA